MRTHIRRTLVCACLAAAAVPAAASAAPVEVDPPGAGVEGAFTTAARDPGCLAKNVIAFRGQPANQVRHSGKIECRRINVRIFCAATLLQGQTRISQRSSRGNDRCSVSAPFTTQRYPNGTRFTQKYRYKLTLENRRKRWSGTTRKCPKRVNDNRTLICKASHTTPAPQKSEETIRS